MKLTLLSMQNNLPPLGLCYISAYLKKYGSFGSRDIGIRDISKFETAENMAKEVLKTKPDIVGIGPVTPDFTKATKIAGMLKQQDIDVIVGGVHITLLPHTLPTVFDAACLGEGEETMLEFMRNYEKAGLDESWLKGTKGIAYHGSGGVVINERRPAIENMDSIPFPDRDALDMKEYLKPRWVFGNYRRRGTSIFTSRGCPYNCIFCSATSFWKKPRFFSAEYVVSEIRHLVEKYKVEAINIYDDLFISHRQRTFEISRMLREEGIADRVEFGCLFRANLFDEEMAKALKGMNVVYASFGAESGSPRILNYLKGPSVKVEDGVRAVRLCKKYGIDIGPSFMMGIPGETKEDLEMTKRFIVDNKLDSAAIYILTPLPGTRIWDLAKERGLVTDQEGDWGRFNIDPDIKRFNDRNLVADNLSLEELIRVGTEIMNETSKKSLTTYNVKFKDLFSTRYLKEFGMRPKYVASKASKIAYYKLRGKIGKLFERGQQD